MNCQKFSSISCLLSDRCDSNLLLLNIHRSTIVHSNIVPAKEQQNHALYKERQNAEEAYKNLKDTEAVPVNMARSMQAPQRIPLGTL